MISLLQPASASSTQGRFFLSCLALALAFVPMSAVAQEAAGGTLFQVMQAENATLKKEAEDLRLQSATLQRDLKARDTELAELQARRTDQGRELDRALQEIGNLKDRLRLAEQRGDDAVTALKDLRSLLASQADAVAAQREQIDISESKQRELRAQATTAAHQETMARAAAERALAQQREAEALTLRQRATTHFNLGVLYTRRSLYREAEAEFLKALAIDPQDADARYNLGILYQDKLRQADKAREQYQGFLAISPQGKDADKVRGWLEQLK